MTSGGTGDKRIKDLVNDISGLRLVANYKDGLGEKATAEMLAMTQYSPGDKHIKVHTSTKHPRV
jgi:CD109 antigen